MAARQDGSWEPGQYGKFSDHRGRPFEDLIARVGAGAANVVVDLGCGPGLLTLRLAQRWPGARIIGVDSSAAMLAEARQQDSQRLVQWVYSDVESWDPATVGAPIDVITSNALLHWVPTHQQLISRWIGALAPHGWFAMQVPGNFAAPAHTLLREVAARSPRAGELLARVPAGAAVDEPGAYAVLLAGLGCAVDVWETTYQQVLDPAGKQPEPVLEWMMGTAMLPVLEVLQDAGEQADFIAEYGGALANAYPRQSFGTVFPFRRVFAVAHRRPVIPT